MAPRPKIADIVTELLGDDLEVGLRAYDGSHLGPADPPATIVVESPEVLRHLVAAPGELGLGRAYVAGALDVEGDTFAVLALRDRLSGLHLGLRERLRLARMVGPGAFRSPDLPPEEIRLKGTRHSRARDAAAIAHHYDLSNDFYALVLGPSMTYSCAVFESPVHSLEQAQAAKYELICRKLDLHPGQRLLDIGCGWGGMVRHAARHHGVQAVGITVSQRQAEWAEKRVADEGLADQVEIRLQDYRDVDGPYDAISSIGMFEHVGLERLAEYFGVIKRTLRSGGRLLNHGISRPAGDRSNPRFNSGGFIDRYVFPDGELHEVGTVVSAIQSSGLEVRHVESLREHYARTLRCWVANLEAHWDEAVALVGEGRSRVWRLYMAGCAVMFEAGKTQIHQVLATNTAPDGASRVPLRSRWESTPLSPAVP